MTLALGPGTTHLATALYAPCLQPLADKVAAPSSSLCIAMDELSFLATIATIA